MGPFDPASLEYCITEPVNAEAEVYTEGTKAAAIPDSLASLAR